MYSGVFGVDTTHPDTVIGDVRETALVRKLVAESDYVIHAAALADVAACTREPADAIASTSPVPRPSRTPSPRATACAA
ncbi:polysaccharide biosynthesis protein [Streptomyces cyaneofuscatus]|uniref:polysaccharide biosynthesis protein n=1 Tax=Streptomyces sp. 021-4 TaxID=2789260 RepID=UPI0039F4C640